MTQVAGNLTATLRLYTNGTYCLRPYPEPWPDYCLVSGTYQIAPADGPTARTSVTTTSAGIAASGLLQAVNPAGALIFSVVTQPAQGVVSITDTATGAFTYTPNAGASGYDPFTFAVGGGGPASQATQMVFVVAAAPQWPGQNSTGERVQLRVSVTLTATYLCGWRWLTYRILFECLNLGAGPPADRRVYVHSRTGSLTHTIAGSRGGDVFSITPDGRYVAFSSNRSTVLPGDTNGVTDVFVHDRQLDTTTRVSVASNGAQGDGESVRPKMSADGRYVVFQSRATNLAQDDTNNVYDAFVTTDKQRPRHE